MGIDEPGGGLATTQIDIAHHGQRAHQSKHQAGHAQLEHDHRRAHHQVYQEQAGEEQVVRDMGIYYLFFANFVLHGFLRCVPERVRALSNSNQCQG